jgi:hypothetical protein
MTGLQVTVLLASGIRKVTSTACPFALVILLASQVYLGVL